jgi:hypothetical protein
MALATTTVELPQVQAAPLAYKLKQAEALGPQTISATFDGTGAGGPFLACCTFKAQDGKVIARCPIDTALNAGDVAEVTFAPFLKAASAGAAGSGIQFDVDNVGSWLQIETNGSIPSEPGIGVDIHSEGLNGGMTIRTDFQPLFLTGGGDLNHGGVQILSNGNGLSLILDSPSATPLIIDTAQSQLINIGGSEAASGNINLGGDPIAVGNTVGFFNAGGATQQAHPTTLADVITVLQNLGLVA